MSASNEEFISVSDMMTGLMMVFLFVSVVYMQQVQLEQQAVEKLAVNYSDRREQLNKALVEEFRSDLEEWNAEILEDSTIRFNEPDVLFDLGSTTIKPRFEVILNNFYPRYVKVLASETFRDSIEELRIEGHTSSTWEDSRDLLERYLKNAQLSQQRSFAILEYCFSLARILPYQKWLTKVLRANGLAFANPIVVNGKEDYARSRRVEFKVRTKAEERIHEIIKTIRGPVAEQ